MHNTVNALLHPALLVDQAWRDDAAPVCVDFEVADVCEPDPEVPVGEGVELLPTRAVSLSSSTKEALTLVALTQAEGLVPLPSTKLTTAH